ncbi:MAG: hypothetical protein RL685_2891 [Pseudomonadota bacterium]
MSVPPDPVADSPRASARASGAQLRRDPRSDSGSEPPAEAEPSLPPPSRRRLPLPVLLLGAALVLVGLGALARHWLWLEIRAEAAAQGVQLDGCQLDFGWERLTLRSCQFASSRDSAGPGPHWIFGSARVNGRVEEVEIALSVFRPERVRLRGAEVSVRGEVPWLDLLRSMRARSESAAPELPLDVLSSRLLWISGDAPNPWLSLSALEYHSGTEQLAAELAAFGLQGHLSMQQGNLALTLGDSERPKVRVSLRAGAGQERAELGVDLRALQLTELEGSWLVLSDVLRPVQVEGRIFVTLPLGLTAELPAGEVHLTLAHLQFPVPKEVEGLVYASPPKISGKLTLARSLDRATIKDLQFQTGALRMMGDAQLELAGEGVNIASNLSGPLSCATIAEAALRAHASSLLAQWLQGVPKKVVRGSVQIAAAVQAHSSDLPHARVLTSIGVGCGLRPLPLAAELPRELLERLPEEIRRRLPPLDLLPKLPKLPLPGAIPDTLQLPPLPGLKPPSRHGRPSSASG